MSLSGMRRSRVRASGRPTLGTLRQLPQLRTGAARRGATTPPPDNRQDQKARGSPARGHPGLDRLPRRPRPQAGCGRGLRYLSAPPTNNFRMARPKNPERIRLAHCEIVCVNCHRRRTARRACGWRLDPETRLALEPCALKGRNFSVVLEVLRGRECLDCGEADFGRARFRPRRPEERLGGGSRCSARGAGTPEERDCSLRDPVCQLPSSADPRGTWRLPP